MILLEITNSPEVIKEKVGKLLEEITPDKLDQALVESQIIKSMVEKLRSEGLKGKISCVQGIELKEDSLTTKNSFKVKNIQDF